MKLINFNSLPAIYSFPTFCFVLEIFLNEWKMNLLIKFDPLFLKVKNIFQFARFNPYYEKE